MVSMLQKRGLVLSVAGVTNTVLSVRIAVKGSIKIINSMNVKSLASDNILSICKSSRVFKLAIEKEHRKKSTPFSTDIEA